MDLNYGPLRAQGFVLATVHPRQRVRGVGFSEGTVEELFNELSNIAKTDPDMNQLSDLRIQRLQLIEYIQNTIGIDLETRFWHWLYRRLVAFWPIVSKT